MKVSRNVEKIAFVVSVMFLSFLYGAAVGRWEWFPYSFLDRAVDQGRRFMSPEAELLEILDRQFDRRGAKVYRPADMQPGVTAVTSTWETSDGWKVGMKLIDRDGEVLHEWLVDREAVFENFKLHWRAPGNIHGSLLMPNGDVLINLEYVGMARLNSCGQVLWTLREGNHHSIALAEDGTFWVPGVDEERRRETEKNPDGFPGLKRIWLDRMLHISENGEILQDINVIDVLYANDLERLLFQHWKTEGDVTHLNDIEPLSSSLADEYPLFEAGDLVVSLKNINLVFVFDPETNKVKWHARDPFIQQHDPDFIGDGWIGIFDNNWKSGRTSGGSEILAMQPHTDSTKILFKPDHLDRFYTYIRGKWQNLPNGNLLLTESETSRVVEVTPGGHLVWEWVYDSDDPKIPPLTDAVRHDLTREQIASWPCSSTGVTYTSSNER